MVVMNYPDNRRFARQVRIGSLDGERIKLYTSTKVGRARKAPRLVLKSPGSSA